MKRLFGMINGILPFFAAILLQYSFFVLLDIGLRAIPSFRINPSETLYYAGVIASFLCGLSYFLWYTDIIHRRKLAIPKHVFRSSNILLLMSLGLSAQFAISGMMSLVQPLLRDLFQEYDLVIGSILNHNPFVVLIYVVLIAPITEELIFRGTMLERLRESLPFYGANLIQAAIFGVYHWNMIQGAYAFGIGLLLGYITRRFRSLTASILLHMAINGTAYLVTLLPRVKAVIISATVVGVLVMGGLLLIIHRRTAGSEIMK